MRYHEIAEQLHHRRQNYHLDYRINGFSVSLLGWLRNFLSPMCWGSSTKWLPARRRRSPQHAGGMDHPDSLRLSDLLRLLRLF